MIFFDKTIHYSISFHSHSTFIFLSGRLAEIMPIPYPSRRMSLLDTPSSLNGNPTFGNWLPVNYGKQLLSVTAVSETSKFGSIISAEHICPIPLSSLQYIKEFGKRHNGSPCLAEVSRSNKTGMQCYMENFSPPYHQSPRSDHAIQTWNDKTTNHGTTIEIRNKLGNALDLSNKSTRSPDSNLHDTTQTPLQAFDHIPGSVPQSTDSEPSENCDRQQETLLSPLQSCMPSLRPFFRAIDSSLPTIGEHHQDIIQTHAQSFRSPVPRRSTCEERSVYSSVTRSNSPTQPGEEEMVDLEPAIQQLLRQGPEKIVLWGVDRVVQFVSSIQGCQEYCDVSFSRFNPKKTWFQTEMIIHIISIPDRDWSGLPLHKSYTCWEYCLSNVFRTFQFVSHFADYVVILMIAIIIPAITWYYFDGFQIICFILENNQLSRYA